MKSTLPVLLALSATGGLVAVGFSPEAKPALVTVQEPATQQQPPPTIGLPMTPGLILEPPFFTVQPGPPAPFDPTRPLHVRVPQGYDWIPAGDHVLQPSATADGRYCVWPMRGTEIWTFSVAQARLPSGWNAVLHLIYLAPGQHPTLPGQPLAFSESRGIGADGSITPGVLTSGGSRFGGAPPWIVYQP